MAKVLLLGCGQLGTAIAVNLHQQGYDVIGVRQSNKLLPLAMRTIQADIFNNATQDILQAIQPEYIIYCLSATAQTDESYHQHYVAGLKNVIASQENNTFLKRLFFVSSTRVYGQTGETLLNEDSPAIPTDFGGNRLLEAENCLKNLAYPTTILRLSGIYCAERLYLVKMAQDLKRWPTENSWSNRIHQSDAAAFIAYLVLMSQKEQILPLYIVTDSQPTKQYDVLIWLAQKMQINIQHLEIPVVSNGKRLSNARLLETGFNLKYPNFQLGYSEILQSIL